MSTLVPALLLLLSGCPDPTNAPAADLDDAGAGTTDAAGGLGSSGEGAAGGTMHTVDATVEPGEGVVLSGTIIYEGEKTGRIRLDVLTSRGNNPHLLAKTLELPSLGEWSIELPEDFGSVNVVGFLDQTGDGPTPDDPAMAMPAPIIVGTEDITGLVLELSDDPNLGALTPTAPPPEPGATPSADGMGTPTGEPIVGGPGDPGGPGGVEPDGQPSGLGDAQAGPPPIENEHFEPQPAPPPGEPEFAEPQPEPPPEGQPDPGEAQP